MKFKRFISMMTVIAMALTFLPVMHISASAEGETYTCDFTQLVKNDADTTYGTTTDIYTLDDYTT
ncbi:MAG: hypothetical protein IJX57_04265, partial [Clostridia bacterium]|nr:hypothetical protein [Clostridia bacterium]